MFPKSAFDTVEHANTFAAYLATQWNRKCLVTEDAIANPFIGSQAAGVAPIARDSLRVWLDPRDVTASGGIVVTAPNRVKGDANFSGGSSFAFPAGGTGTTPQYSATGFNSVKPGFVLDGTDRRVFTTIPGSFSGSMTAIIAVHPSADNAWVTTAATPDDVNSGIYIVVGNLSAESARYDDTGTPADATAYSHAIGAVVYTLLIDSVGSTMVQRVNGAQVTTASVTLGAMSPQTQIVITGYTNAVEASLGYGADCTGELGSVMLFDELLSGSTLDYYERFVGTISGITY